MQLNFISDKIEKVELLGTVADAFSLLKKQLQPFLIHTFIYCRQAAHFDTLISQCNTKKVVLQVDFSENTNHELK